MPSSDRRSVRPGKKREPRLLGRVTNGPARRPECKWTRICRRISRSARPSGVPTRGPDQRQASTGQPMNQSPQHELRARGEFHQHAALDPAHFPANLLAIPEGGIESAIETASFSLRIAGRRSALTGEGGRRAKNPHRSRGRLRTRIFAAERHAQPEAHVPRRGVEDRPGGDPVGHQRQ